jgi:hypothetical protein
MVMVRKTSFNVQCKLDILLEIRLSGVAEQRSAKVKLEIPSHSMGDIIKESFE